MIRYILGRAATGKSRRAIEEIGADLKQGGDYPLILFVPEQYTLQAERDLIEQLQLPGIMRVEVLSFNRLAYRILAEAGGRTRVLINEQGKNMIIKKTLNQAHKDLCIYKNASKQEGFVEHLSQLFSELKQYDLTPELLKSSQLEMEAGPQRQKLQDVTLIYEAFINYMEGHYLDLEDQFNLLIDKMEKSSFIKGARVWLDGFTGFTPQNRRILEKIMTLARDTTFCLTIDPKSGRDQELFKPYRRCYEQIHEIAVGNGLPEETVTTQGDKLSVPLRHLTRELYAFPWDTYEDPVNNIKVFAAKNIYSEVEHIASLIVELAREQDYRWRDMAVLCNDLDSYGSVVRRVFYEYRIPYFMDEKRPLDNNPIIKLILASLGVINRGYRQEDIFLLLKTGFTDLNPEECEEMENYMLAYGIQGRLCQENFTRGQNELGTPALEMLNQYRERLFAPLQKLAHETAGKKTGRDISRAMYKYLQVLDIENKLLNWIEELRNQGLYEYAHENAQVLKIVMETFDQLVEILGENELNLKEYAGLLATGYQAFDVGIIPTTVDQVMIGDLKRSKNRNLKALFVMGVNDGIIPAGKSAAGIFTEEDKDFFKNHGLDWGINKEMIAEEESLAIYEAFSKPQNYLYLTYAIADQEGKAMRPSMLINRLHSIFPTLQIQSDLIKSLELEMEHIATADSSFKYLVENLRLYLDGEEIEDLWWDVYGWYFHNQSWDERRQAVLEALFYQNQCADLDSRTAVNLYKSPFRASVSRLEQFAACPFAHFIRYGLRPQERKTFAVGAPDIGVVLHEGMYGFAAALNEQGLNWRDLNQDDCEAVMEKVLEQKLPQHNNGILTSSFRYRYLAKRLKRISHRAVWTLTEHIKNGDFEPLLYEAGFGFGNILPPLKIVLSDGQHIYLEGRIDRIDVLKGEEIDYIKIIDYKSGEKQFSLSDLYFGLNLQLIVYLLAVMKQTDSDLKPRRPAGLFYFKIDDPLISVTDNDLSNIEEKIRKALKMKGLALKDISIVRSMDNALQGNSEFLPLGIKQNDEFTANSSVLEEQEFELLIDYINDLLKELGDEMLRGKIAIEPAKKDKWKACDNCIYHAVCQFDKLFAGNQFKNMAGLQDTEVMTKIREHRGRKADESLD
ncbi:DNA helicase subunit AddB [Syntrophomonas zehnderi OL-4]|uniref:DNA helicase subunit AddB n=1 Tax=Syntrophomonas zehnderi OL-4 TaxID=690567 RepID=A0A0E4G967_9FIRM|nr:helicase-exonuclease AddAB subunit AddB [Syntrophomonas zehnderi]CFW97413.1 DNA helicase subunit AddB [Syntrophomonas zehnderi OL-4]